MKFFRMAIILGIIAFIAGFAYWYFKIEISAKKAEETEREALLFDQTDKDIVKIILKNKEELPLIIEKRCKEGKEYEKTEEDWIILSPVETVGDKYTIQTIVEYIKNSKKERVIQNNLNKENEYGFDNPQFSVRFFYENEDIEHGIDFGMESLDNEMVFAKVIGKEKVFSIPIDIRDSIRLNLFDVRNKYLCDYKIEDIRSLTLVSSISSFMLEKKGDEWFFMPQSTKALKKRLDEYINSVRWVRFVDVVEEKGKNFSKYGLANPRLVLILGLNDESEFNFIVGDLVEENGAEFFYATRSSDYMIFKVKSDIIYDLAKTKFELKE